MIVPYPPTNAPIVIYTDGAFRRTSADDGLSYREMAWGWVVVNAPRQWRKTRVTSHREVAHTTHSASGMMEARTAIQAIAECAPLGRPIHIYSAWQALANLVESYRAGLVTLAYFHNRSAMFSKEDVAPLARLLSTGTSPSTG